MDDSDDTASEPRAGLDDAVAGHAGKVLLDGGDQRGFGRVRQLLVCVGSKSGMLGGHMFFVTTS